ncbi:helix-turn-helix domain-containing protein [Aquabacterium sp. A7-Y]|uniref:helix-turn-helix domain-containing protein n=1 Tax=Aquabacterium sp. A7-Y TaxID=1349605 RepID=UPI00223E88EB|nr:helix-turn-helix transcriptional regulator [Aquabacterium sp. A7-Y]MCW7541866.1 helix-turn-helix domain-containing protein [Aquabacterium sp. A7-Y]
MDVIEAFGAAVRDERLQRQLTLNDLAVRSGLNFRYISRVERGEVVPSLLTVCALADGLDLPVPSLLEIAMAKTTKGRRGLKRK